MDLATIIGLMVGVLSLIIGFMTEGGTIMALIKPTAAMIVFGGTIGAVVLGTSFKKVKKLPFIIKYAFTKSKKKPVEVIEQMTEMSNLSRREGLLALESNSELYSEDEFLSEGIQMIVDGVEGETIQDILNREIDHYEERLLSIGKMFEMAGGFAPTMGIIGTVMGLVHVLGQLANPEELGPSIAVAFIATLYGVASANVLYLPMYNKIKSRVEQEVFIMEMQAEGLLSINYGESGNALRNKLMAYLDDKDKAAMKAPAENPNLEVEYNE